VDRTARHPAHRPDHSSGSVFRHSPAGRLGHPLTWPYGTYTRQVFLGETLDADKIAADYAAGVLTLTIPVREAAKPRSIQVTSSDHQQAVSA
jgi:HSP20 family protein